MIKRVYATASHPVARSILAILVFALSLGAATLTSYADQYVNAGVAWGPHTQRIDHTDVNPLGVNIFLEKEVDPANVEKSLQMVQDAGLEWVRQNFLWNDIEISGKGDFMDRRGPGPWVDAWAKYDRIVEGCLKHGLQIIARLDSPPLWARMPGDDTAAFPKGPPARYEDYGDFVSAVVSRYKGKIRYFQIWNEPNLIGEWGGHPISAEEYTALLKVAHDAAKEANPDAVIITAALAPTAERSIRNLNDVLYLEAMYRAGAAAYFDIFSTMLYGLGQPPSERRIDLDRLNFSRPIMLREVMEKYGDANKPIWISEYAWISLPPDFQGDPSKNIWGKSVDEETQGRWLVEGYERAAAEWPWMGVMAVWHFRDPNPIPNEPANYFAIVKEDFTPRPAYNAIKEYSQRRPATRMPPQKPLWNAVGFPALYGLFLLLAAVSGAYSLSRLGVWVGAALDRPRGRYSDAARETARNAMAVVGMAVLAGIYYKADSLPLVLLSLIGWGLLAFLKPSTALAAVAFTIPFFWYPKVVRQQHFPLAETMLMLTFGALMARRVVGYLLPGLAVRLNFPSDYRRPQTSPPNVGMSNGKGQVSALPSDARLPVEDAISPEHVDAGELIPASWPSRPVTAPLASTPRQAAAIQTVATSKGVEVVSTGQARGPAPTDIAQNGRAPETLSNAPQSQSRFTFHVSLLVSRFIQHFKAWNRQDAFAPPAVALLIVGTLSLFTLADPGFLRDSLRAYRWVILEPVLFYFLITEIITTRRGLWRMADFFVGAAVLVAFIGLGQFVLGANTLEVQGVSRVFGVYQHPNNLALYLGRVLPFVACVGVFLPWGWRKGLYLAATVPLALTTFLTFSRGAYLAVVVATGVAVAVGLLWRSGQSQTGGGQVSRRRLVMIGSSALAILGLALILVAALLPILPARFLNVGSGVLRLELWKSSFRMLADHPIFGVGIDQFLNQFQAHYITPAQEIERYTAHPHNLFLDYWLALGIMGLLILLWLLWRYFREALAKARSLWTGPGQDSSADRAQALAGRAIALGLLASMLDFLLHGLVDNSYFLMDLAMVFWLCCGLLQLTRLKIED